MNVKKCKISGRQEKSHLDDWCNIGNQKSNNSKNQSPQKPSSNNASDEKKNDETLNENFVMAAKIETSP